MSTVASAWGVIDGWLLGNAPAIAADLRGPASAAEIARAEALLGQALPDEIRASYFVHDGQGGNAPYAFAQWRLLSLAHVVEQFLMLQGLRRNGDFDVPGVIAIGRTRAEWLARGWAPVLADGAGNYVMADLDPAPGGVAGQLVEFRGREPVRTVIAPGFGAWLARWASDFTQARYQVDESGALVRIAS